MPGESFGDHAEILLDLEIHGEIVSVGVHESLVVIVAQGVTTDEGQHVAVKVVLGAG